MKARIKWLEDMTLIGESESGHAVVMDGPAELGGHNLGLRPDGNGIAGHGRLHRHRCPEYS